MGSFRSDLEKLGAALQTADIRAICGQCPLFAQLPTSQQRPGGGLPLRVVDSADVR
jgi:hypothetical protein